MTYEEIIKLLSPEAAWQRAGFTQTGMSDDGEGGGEMMYSTPDGGQISERALREGMESGNAAGFSFDDPLYSNNIVPTQQMDFSWINNKYGTNFQNTQQYLDYVYGPGGTYMSSPGQQDINAPINNNYNSDFYIPPGGRGVDDIVNPHLRYDPPEKGLSKWMPYILATVATAGMTGMLPGTTSIFGGAGAGAGAGVFGGDFASTAALAEGGIGAGYSATGGALASAIPESTTLGGSFDPSWAAPDFTGSMSMNPNFTPPPTASEALFGAAPEASFLQTPIPASGFPNLSTWSTASDLATVAEAGKYGGEIAGTSSMAEGGPTLWEQTQQVARSIWGDPIGKEAVKMGAKTAVKGVLGGGNSDSDFNKQMMSLAAATAAGRSNSFGGGSAVALPTSPGTSPSAAGPSKAFLSGARSTMSPEATINSMNRPAGDPNQNTGGAVDTQRSSPGGRQNGAVDLGTRPKMFV